MGKFQSSEYEEVKDRIKRFYKDYPDGRIVTSFKTLKEDGRAVFKASVFLSADDQEKDLVKATGWAEEWRETEMKVSKSGQKYADVNYTSWTENAETSAIGRALANMGYSGDKRPSREEMQKVQRHGPTQVGPEIIIPVATVKQVQLLQKLGVKKLPDNLTKKQASEMIGKLMDKKNGK